jgi:hypothetical protein
MWAESVELRWWVGHARNSPASRNGTNERREKDIFSLLLQVSPPASFQNLHIEKY